MHAVPAGVVARGGTRARRSMAPTAYKRFLPIVRRIAMRLAQRVPPSIPVADLVGYGWVGLMEAFQRVTTDMPDEEFQAYALYRVRGAMLDYLRSLDPATRELRRGSRRVAGAIRDLTRTLGREPGELEIAEYLGIGLAAYRALVEKIAAAGVTRLELLDLDEIQEIQLDSAGEGIDDKVAKRRLAEAVAAAMGTLSPRLLRVLELYYEEEFTLRQIGGILGVGESRVSQLHTEALHRLRAAVAQD